MKSRSLFTSQLWREIQQSGKKEKKTVKWKRIRVTARHKLVVRAQTEQINTPSRSKASMYRREKSTQTDESVMPMMFANEVVLCHTEIQLDTTDVG